MEQQLGASMQNNQSEPTKNSIPRNVIKGLFFILGPFIGIVIALLGSVLINTIIAIAGLDSSNPTIGLLIMDILRWLLYLVGFLSIIMIPVGIIVGIIYLTKKN